MSDNQPGSPLAGQGTYVQSTQSCPQLQYPQYIQHQFPPYYTPAYWNQWQQPLVNSQQLSQILNQLQFLQVQVISLQTAIETLANGK
jgi:hypothetical protein